MSLLRALDRTSAVSQHPARPFLPLQRSFLPLQHPFLPLQHPFLPLQRPFLPRSCPIIHRKEASRRGFGKSAVRQPPRVARTWTWTGTITSTSEHNERREYKSTKAKQERRGPIKRLQQFAEQELKALVDYYEMDLKGESVEEPVDDGGPVLWNVGDDHQPSPFKSMQDRAAAEKLEKMLEEEETPHEHVFATYKQLPAPGVVYLQIETVRSLLHHLSIVDRPTPIAMQRFLSILDDMKNAHIHIVRSEWTTAIYLAGRFMSSVSSDQLQTALHLWRDMEKRAHIKGSLVTMNVLFDIAVKAGKYTLAETFLKEMVARGLKFHRHFRVSLIYYHGVQQNGNRVRKAYQDLVEAGDIVDTVVMNAVIAALIRAGEPAAAEHVFERMKRLAASKSNLFVQPLPYNNRLWRGRRHLGLHFTHTAAMLSKIGDKDKLKELQDAAPIAPNSRTYSLLIRHYARVAGNIDRVMDLLRDMGYNGVPVEGSIFIVIFHGFQRYGGVRYSSWTRPRLEQTWHEYLDAVRSGLDRSWASRMAIVSALKAFRKCADADRVLSAWDEVRPLWQLSNPSPQEMEGVLKALRRLVPRDGFFDGRV